MNDTATEIRRTVIKMANRAKSPHVGSALSCVDIISTLYHKVMNIQKPVNEDRDIFILSKAHASMALYATLFSKGFMSEKELEGYYANDGSLPAHTDRHTSDYVEVSAGSLGHGLPMGVGFANAFRLAGSGRKVFVVMGDGETQEGSVWESAMLAPKLGINNLTLFIDYNNLQGYGRAKELVSFDPLDEKWRSFGWDVAVINGHDHAAIEREAKRESDRPKVVICNTVKGKGVSFMEDQLIWHYYIVTDELRDKALAELK